MWLSKEVAASNKRQEVSLFSEVTKLGNGKVTAQGEREYRDLFSICPFGLVSLPVVGSKAVVTPVGNNFVLSGVVSSNLDLLPGEVMLYSSGGASLVLKNDGRVLINGSEIT